MAVRISHASNVSQSNRWLTPVHDERCRNGLAAPRIPPRTASARAMRACLAARVRQIIEQRSAVAINAKVENADA